MTLHFSSLPFTTLRIHLLGIVAAGISLVGLTPGALADDVDERLAKLPPGTALIGSRGMKEFQLNGSAGKAEFVDVEGQPFRSAVRVTTSAPTENRWGLQLAAKSAAAVHKGDSVFASFWARAVTPARATGEAQTEFVFEQRGGAYTKFVKYPVVLSTRWQRFYVPFEAPIDLPAGEAQACFHAGYAPQAIEIAGLEVTDYGAAVKARDLPLMPVTYDGREADAAWRKAAAERIEKYRKGDLVVRVRDAAGQAVPNATVAVRMKRHAYGFGTAVNAKLLLEESANADRYREVLLQNFNKATIENHLKWPLWEEDRGIGLQAVAWLREHQLAVRGHVLVWPGKTNLPKRVLELFSTPDALRQAVVDHISDELGAFRGQCAEWDVMNEPFDNNAIQFVLAGRPDKAPRIDAATGAAFIADWYKAARAADPDTRLDINDYSILSTGGTDSAHQDYYEKTVRALLALGAPVQAIGMQGHFGEDLTPIPRILEILDRFGALGLPIQVTEHDINTSDERLQGDYTRDFMTAFFSHPSTVGIMVWGFWQEAHWIPNAALYRSDWTPRPAGEVWRDLVFKQWWTNADGQTRADGTFATRGFLGDYEIKVIAGGATQTVKTGLPASGTTLDVVLGQTAAR